ncbi:MAG: SDR family oxidoreductase [Natronospirillum sp.]
MDLKLHGQTVLVAGASEGIGFATAQLFLEEGARVLIASRSAEKLTQAAAQLQQATDKTVEWKVADLRNADDVEALADWVGTFTSALDVLVTTVGGSHRATFAELTDVDWLASYEFNLLGTVRIIRALQPSLSASGNGRIITLGAGAARMPYPNQIVSNVHKAGMLSLVKTLAAELADQHIRINSVCPGRTLTSLWTNRADAMAAERGVDRDTIIEEFTHEIPMKRFGQAVESANMIVFLASPLASYVTGQSINVDGGIARSLL